MMKLKVKVLEKRICMKDRQARFFVVNHSLLETYCKATDFFKIIFNVLVMLQKI